ncbi:MAG: DUF2333 family protein [Desulfovibrio sp.]|nr:DUF2333 family protein [Desulfovibrio sp.]
MKFPEMPLFFKLRIVWHTVLVQCAIFIGLLFVFWGAQRFYSAIDTTTFPKPCPIVEAANTLPDIEKGKVLIDAITHQMRSELNSTFGWSINDILFNPYILDNRAYRQYGVYHATKFLVDIYSTQIAKLGTSDRESDFLYQARLNCFTLNPRKFWFPSAESSYKKGLKLIEQYKESLDQGKGVYNCRTDDIYASLQLLVGENMLGYAQGLLENAQNIPFYTLDNRIYEIQGMVLVMRDFLNAVYLLYPEIKAKNNEENMAVAMDYMNRICVYDPLYITSTMNSGELILSYLLFAKARIADIMTSLRI